MIFIQIYLITSTSYTTATGLSKVLDNSLSHDKVTRLLKKEKLDNHRLWTFIKPLVRSVEQKNSGLIVRGSQGILWIGMGIDNTIFEKPHTDESEINTYHYDHSQGKSVKGINAVNLIHETEGIRLPLSLSILHKDEWVEDKGKLKRKSSQTKNELFREQFLSEEIPLEGHPPIRRSIPLQCQRHPFGEESFGQGIPSPK